MLLKIKVLNKIFNNNSLITKRGLSCDCLINFVIYCEHYYYYRQHKS